MAINQTGATSTNKLFSLEFSFKCQPDLISFPLHFHIFLFRLPSQHAFTFFSISLIFFHLSPQGHAKARKQRNNAFDVKKKTFFSGLRIIENFLRYLNSCGFCTLNFTFKEIMKSEKNSSFFLEIRYFWAGKHAICMMS